MAEILNKKEVYSGKAFSVFRYKIDYEGQLLKRDVIHRKNGVVIVPILGNDILLLREYCAGSNSHILSLPGGKIDRDEAPESAARRELLEETGFNCSELIKLRFSFEHPSTSNRKSYVFAARGLVNVDPISTNEILEVVQLPFQEAVRACLVDFESDVSTFGSLMLAQPYLESSEVR